MPAALESAHTEPKLEPPVNPVEKPPKRKKEKRQEAYFTDDPREIDAQVELDSARVAKILKKIPLEDRLEAVACLFPSAERKNTNFTISKNATRAYDSIFAVALKARPVENDNVQPVYQFLCRILMQEEILALLGTSSVEGAKKLIDIVIKRNTEAGSTYLQALRAFDYEFDPKEMKATTSGKLALLASDQLVNPLTYLLSERVFSSIEEFAPVLDSSTTFYGMLGLAYGKFDAQNPLTAYYKRHFTKAGKLDDRFLLSEFITTPEEERYESPGLRKLKTFWPAAFTAYWSYTAYTQNSVPNRSLNPLSLNYRIPSNPSDMLGRDAERGHQLTSSLQVEASKKLSSKMREILFEYSTKTQVDGNMLRLIFNKERCHHVLKYLQITLPDLNTGKTGIRQIARNLIDAFDTDTGNLLDNLFDKSRFRSMDPIEITALIAFFSFSSNGTVSKETEGGVKSIDAILVPLLNNHFTNNTTPLSTQADLSLTDESYSVIKQDALNRLDGSTQKGVVIKTNAELLKMLKDNEEAYLKAFKLNYRSLQNLTSLDQTKRSNHIFWLTNALSMASGIVAGAIHGETYNRSESLYLPIIIALNTLIGWLALYKQDHQENLAKDLDKLKLLGENPSILIDQVRSSQKKKNEENVWYLKKQAKLLNIIYFTSVLLTVFGYTIAGKDTIVKAPFLKLGENVAAANQNISGFIDKTLDDLFLGEFDGSDGNTSGENSDSELASSTPESEDSTPATTITNENYLEPEITAPTTANHDGGGFRISNSETLPGKEQLGNSSFKTFGNHRELFWTDSLCYSFDIITTELICTTVFETPEYIPDEIITRGLTETELYKKIDELVNTRNAIVRINDNPLDGHFGVPAGYVISDILTTSAKDPESGNVDRFNEEAYISPYAVELTGWQSGTVTAAVFLPSIEPTMLVGSEQYPVIPLKMSYDWQPEPHMQPIFDKAATMKEEGASAVNILLTIKNEINQLGVSYGQQQFPALTPEVQQLLNADEFTLEKQFNELFSLENGQLKYPLMDCDLLSFAVYFIGQYADVNVGLVIGNVQDANINQGGYVANNHMMVTYRDTPRYADIDYVLPDDPYRVFEATLPRENTQELAVESATNYVVPPATDISATEVLELDEVERPEADSAKKIIILSALTAYLSLLAAAGIKRKLQNPEQKLIEDDEEEVIEETVTQVDAQKETPTVPQSPPKPVFSQLVPKRHRIFLRELSEASLRAKLRLEINERLKSIPSHAQLAVWHLLLTTAGLKNITRPLNDRDKLGEKWFDFHQGVTQPSPENAEQIMYDFMTTMLGNYFEVSSNLNALQKQVDLLAQHLHSQAVKTVKRSVFMDAIQMRSIVTVLENDENRRNIVRSLNELLQASDAALIRLSAERNMNNKPLNENEVSQIRESIELLRFFKDSAS